jgi:hypothetical protein
MSLKREIWPSLPLSEWIGTYETIHRWSQIIGKIRIALEPLMNHWWNSTLYVTSRGLTTSAMPYENMQLQIDFDFLDHFLVIQTSKGITRKIPLKPIPVAEMFKDIMYNLGDIDIYVPLWTTPVEVADRTPFEEDYKHASYDREYVTRMWTILFQTNRVFTEFRSRFIGKVSPVHFFWGAFDLAVTRFSGRTAPSHSGAPGLAKFVAVEAYSHEVSSCGFWPGGGDVDNPVYYSYAYPEPHGFKDHAILPKEAYYEEKMGEFVLPYEVVRNSENPDGILMDFLESTYSAAAATAKWDRDALERRIL